MTFEPFPKLARLSRECVVTEKIDGTNAQVFIEPVEHQGFYEELNGVPLLYTVIPVDGVMTLVAVWAGSRTRLIRPGKDTDNFGFAEWVLQHGCALVEGLGVGRHFGEWYGQGIQRGYGLDHKRFALFNTERWASQCDHKTIHLREGQQWAPRCCHVVPELWRGEFDSARINGCLTMLTLGSRAVEGFMSPEGIVVYHTHARVAFKKTFDDRHKEAA